MPARRRPAARAPSASGATRAIRPDLVHTHLVHADVYGALAAARARAVLVSTKHNDDPFRSGKGRYLEQLLTEGGARSSASPRLSRASTATSWDFPAPKLRVVHYGLDAPPEPWGPPGGPELPRTRPCSSPSRRLVRQKGVDVAIDALARDTGTASCCAARRARRGAAASRARRAGCEARASPTRSASRDGSGDVAWWLRRANVVVHPARWEGFGLALLEAMLCERPVVANGGQLDPRDRGRRRDRAARAAGRSRRALAEAVIALLDDPARAAGAGRRRPNPCTRRVLGRADGRTHGRGLRGGVDSRAGRAPRPLLSSVPA